MPKIAEKLCPNVQYWANSPWGGAKEANDLTVGDVHQWDGSFLSPISKRQANTSSLAWQIPLIPGLQIPLWAICVRIRNAWIPRYEDRE
jgi:hypothetical protein